MRHQFHRLGIIQPDESIITVTSGSVINRIRMNGSVLHPENTVGSRGKPFIVGNDDGCQIISGAEAQEQSQNLVASLLIKIAGRLIGKQERWGKDESPGERSPLLLSTRELSRPVINPRAETDPAEQLTRLRPGGASVISANQHRHHNIFKRREFREKVMELKDEADPTIAKLA